MPNRKNRPNAALLRRLRGFARDLAAAAGERVLGRQRRGNISRNRKGVGDFVTELTEMLGVFHEKRVTAVIE